MAYWPCSCKTGECDCAINAHRQALDRCERLLVKYEACVEFISEIAYAGVNISSKPNDGKKGTNERQKQNQNHS